MKDFETGICSYVHAAATVHVFFPVDAKGNADICCEQCPFYRIHSRRCGLNDTVCAYPNKYVGRSCPLQKAEEGDTWEYLF